MADAVPRTLDRIEWPVRTERLTLRPVTADDAERIFAIRTQSDVTRWITAAITTRAEVDEWIERRGDQAIAIVLDGTQIGDLMLRVEDAWAQREVRDEAAGRQAELGWILDPAYGGRGYATEAVSALIDLCFERLGLRRVVAYCFADNTASWRLMERLGMRRETHTIGDSLHRSGRWLDGYGYALLADDWRARRG